MHTIHLSVEVLWTPGHLCRLVSITDAVKLGRFSQGVEFTLGELSGLCLLTTLRKAWISWNL